MEFTEQQKADFFLKSIYKKAWKDKTFLRKLVKNPIQTLNSFTGKKGALPTGKVLIVEDQTNPNHIYLNLPAKPVNTTDVELSDEHLDHVSGAGITTRISWNYIYNSVKKEIKNLF
ncbi:MAG: TOMM propeptide domain-containing protein [Bacteroidota bacterium]